MALITPNGRGGATIALNKSEEAAGAQILGDILKY